MTEALAATSIRGQLKRKVRLSGLTSWRVGGPAKLLFQPADKDDLVCFIEQLPAEEPLTLLGMGSNVLVRDGGIPGIVIGTHALRKLTLEAGRVYAEAGVPCAHLTRLCVNLGLSGAEFLAGIPGTVGGALAMNAGAFGGEIWEWVEEVETVDRHGQIHRRRAEEYQIGYRSVLGPKEYFLAAWLRFPPGDPEMGRRRIRELLARRSQSQPTGWPSGGSVFKNPPGEKAGRLIEACGLKGKILGGAKISEVHANFILNVGGAKAADIEALIGIAREEVKACFGIELEPEVRILGIGGENEAT